VAAQLVADERVVPVEQIAPWPVTQLGSPARGVDMSVKSTVASARSGRTAWRAPVRNSSISPAIARSRSTADGRCLELDVACAWDLLRDVAPALDVEEVARAVQHERRHAHEWQDRLEVDVHPGADDRPRHRRARGGTLERPHASR